jgi:hypothetical protein
MARLVNLEDFGQQVRVFVHHLTEEESVQRAKQENLVKDPSRVVRVTLCEIQKADTKEILSQVRSVCVKPDQFVKVKGSRNAIKKACSELKLTRKDRTNIFNQMFSSSN